MIQVMSIAMLQRLKLSFSYDLLDTWFTAEFNNSTCDSIDAHCNAAEIHVVLDNYSDDSINKLAGL